MLSMKADVHLDTTSMHDRNCDSRVSRPCSGLLRFPAQDFYDFYGYPVGTRIEARQQIADEASLYFTRDMLPSFKDMVKSAVKGRLADITTTYNVKYKAKAGNYHTYTLADAFAGMSTGEAWIMSDVVCDRTG